jgi:hypothetical protein
MRTPRQLTAPSTACEREGGTIALPGHVLFTPAARSAACAARVHACSACLCVAAPRRGALASEVAAPRGASLRRFPHCKLTRSPPLRPHLYARTQAAAGASAAAGTV